MKCSKCNFEMPETAKFCPECGENLSELLNYDIEAPHKKEAKKQTKKLLIVITSLVALSIFSLIAVFNNYFCIFGHDLVYETVEPKCTTKGYTRYQCRYHKNWNGELDEKEKLGHNVLNTECGDNATCSVCNVNVTTHEKRYIGSEECMHCGKPEYNLSLPITPKIVNIYNSKDQILESFIISSLRLDDDVLTYTIERTYHYKGENYSDTARFGWKLYDSHNQVVESGTARANVSIKTGESTTGTIDLRELDKWKDYRLEIIHIS